MPVPDPLLPLPQFGEGGGGHLCSCFLMQLPAYSRWNKTWPPLPLPPKVTPLCNSLTLNMGRICDLLLTYRMWQKRGDVTSTITFIDCNIVLLVDSLPCWFWWSRQPCCEGSCDQELGMAPHQQSLRIESSFQQTARIKLGPPVQYSKRIWTLLTTTWDWEQIEPWKETKAMVSTLLTVFWWNPEPKGPTKPGPQKLR